MRVGADVLGDHVHFIKIVEILVSHRAFRSVVSRANDLSLVHELTDS